MLGKDMHSLFGAALLAAFAFTSGALLLPSYSQAQSSGTDSVADAARRAREAKKAAPTGTKVYTDDDVKPATSSASAPPTQTGSGAAPATGDAPAPTQAAPAAAEGTAPAADANATPRANPGKADEKAWRDKFRGQRDQIARLEKELDVLQREEEKAQVQYYPDPQKALSEGYSRKDINEKDTKIAAKKDEIAKANQALADLEDDLRKSGGDPGWSRE
jgi:hypothetical protein